MILAEFDHVTRRYGDVVDDISLTIGAGTPWAFWAPTAPARRRCSLLQVAALPTAGTVTSSAGVRRMPVAVRRSWTTPQETALPETLRGRGHRLCRRPLRRSRALG